MADDGRKVAVCKTRLTLLSGFFQGLSAWESESDSKEIKISGTSSKILEKLDSLSTAGTVTLNSRDEILELLSLSEQFLMPELKLDLLSHLGKFKTKYSLVTLLERVSIDTPAEKLAIAMFLVNNWDQAGFTTRDIDSHLQYFFENYK